MTSVAACGDDEQDVKMGLDASVDADASGQMDAVVQPYDPYWTDYDAAVDLKPTEPPARQHVWADWTSYSIGADGGASALLLLSADASVGVAYVGELYNAQVDDSGVPYWGANQAYLSTAVTNTPTMPDNIMLAGGDNQVHELTFSTPVENPVLLVMSLGSSDETTVCRFDDEFELLSHGPGFYGEGMPLKHLPDHVLSGRESSGAIRFPGTHSSIRWKTVISEPWFGLTVGIPSPQRP